MQDREGALREQASLSHHPGVAVCLLSLSPARAVQGCPGESPRPPWVALVFQLSLPSINDPGACVAPSLLQLCIEKAKEGRLSQPSSALSGCTDVP